MELFYCWQKQIASEGVTTVPSGYWLHRVRGNYKKMLLSDLLLLLCTRKLSSYSRKFKFLAVEE